MDSNDQPLSERLKLSLLTVSAIVGFRASNIISDAVFALCLDFNLDIDMTDSLIVKLIRLIIGLFSAILFVMVQDKLLRSQSVNSKIVCLTILVVLALCPVSIELNTTMEAVSSPVPTTAPVHHRIDFRMTYSTVNPQGIAEEHVLLQNRDLVAANPSKNSGTVKYVTLKLTAEAQSRLEAATTKNVGAIMKFWFNEELECEEEILAPLTKDTIAIPKRFSLTEAETVSKALMMHQDE